MEGSVLPSFSSFGNVKSKRMTDDGHQVMAKAHIAFGKVC
jgi:hypothetical protein